MSEHKGKDPSDIGALWIKQGSKGEYLSGIINGESVVCFRNDRKTGNQPDWRVLKSKPRSEKSAPAPSLDSFDADPLGF